MTGTAVKDAKPAVDRVKQLIFGLLSLTAIIAVALTIRYLGAGLAIAQAPARGPATAGKTKAAPASVGSPATKRGESSAVAARPAAPAAAPTAKTPQVAAVVNGEPITNQDLGRECLRRYGKDMAEEFVNTRVLADACTERGIQVTTQEVDAEVEQIAKKFGLAPDRWMQLLRDERGFSPEQYRTQIVWKTLALKKLTARELQVTQEEIKQGFETEYGPKVRARMIVVSQRALADKVRAEAAANPRNFGKLAEKNCEDASIAAAGGAIPPICKHTNDQAFEKAAFSLQEGEISPVMAVADKFVILLCEKLIDEQVVSPKNIDAAQKRIADRLKENKLRTASANMFSSLREQAQVAIYFDPKNDQKMKQHPGEAASVNGKSISIRQVQDECLKRHGPTVLEGEINRKVLTQALARKKLTITQEDLDAEVAHAAESYGVFQADGRTPDVQKWLKSIQEEDGADLELYQRDAVWPSAAMKKLVDGRVKVTQEDLQKGFEANYGERVQVQAIVLTDQRQAQKVWDMARNNATEQYFGELAQQYSVEPSSRSNGGKVPPIQRHRGAKALEEAAFALKKGELSGIVPMVDQFIILRCLGRTKPLENVTMATVQDQLVRDITEQKLNLAMTEEFKRLVASAQIDNYLAGSSQAGQSVSSRVGENPRIAMPQGGGTQR